MNALTIHQPCARLDEPIPIAGRQGLWRVPQDVTLKLLVAWRAA